MTVKTEARRLTPRQQGGRAVNAIAELLRKRLTVPNIYLEPGSSLIAADVLAVDRAGAGDLHAVEIKLHNVASAINPKLWLLTNVKGTVQRMHQQLVATHFRYLAIPQSTWERARGEVGSAVYSPDGIGRIGIITMRDQGEDLPVAELAIAPERFRVDPVKLGKIEKNLLEKVRPDIEVRV